MLNEILKSIKSHLYERSVSPLMGSFIVSWALWNYKFILLLFSGVPIIEKYRIIDEVLFNTPEHYLLYGFIYPAVTTAAYLFLYPFPAKKVFEYTRKKQKEISDVRKKIEEETLLTLQESQTIKREIFILEEEFQKVISRKNQEIDQLRKELSNSGENDLRSSNEVKKVISQSKSKAIEETKKSKIPEDQEKILIALQSGNEIESALISKLKDNKVRSEYNIQELLKNKFITKDYDLNARQPKYSLDHYGRTYLVKNDLLN